MKKKRMLLCLLSAGMMWMPMTVIAATATSSASVTKAAPEDDQVFTGTVEDAMGPMIGATVRVQGTTNGTLTDADGKFKSKSCRRVWEEICLRKRGWES